MKGWLTSYAILKSKKQDLNNVVAIVYACYAAVVFAIVYKHLFLFLAHYGSCPSILCIIIIIIIIIMRHAVAQLVEALRYKSEGRGFDSRWCHWNFSLT